MLGETINWKRGLGITLTFFGGMLVMWNPGEDFAVSGLALILASAFVGSLAAVLMKQIDGVKRPAVPGMGRPCLRAALLVLLTTGLNPAR